MEVIFASAAKNEVRKAAEFYEKEVEGLGKAFLLALKEGVAEIKRFPYASRIVRGNFRRHLISRFPHGILYQIQGNTVYVIAVMHLKRQPGYWENR